MMTPPCASDIPQNVAECYRLQRECRREREEQHGQVMTALGDIKDQLAEARGAKAEREKQDSKDSHPSTPAAPRKSFMHGLGVKILEYVIITAIAGGLWAAFQREDAAKAQPPTPVVGAKP